ncbi:MAG: MBOAT family O-acyltransferase, partial [Limosilactobacillus sp.]|uniref:MBOAT family O-acyltransferase n=1 Tax=Limosilactobacillus sp. TaxID=2773925 RepID=UPI002A74EF22
ISFYTFQTMSYTIDVYRGDTRAQHSIINFGTFVTLFPQLIAGPIIKYKDLGRQIDHRDHTLDKFASGIQIFVVGLAKKVLLANNLGQLWDAYQATPLEQLTTAGAWLGVIAFSLQLYFDFSGYSDMAIGLGRMLGFEFLPNFNYPYISKSVTEFWRRWHISLGTWFREYVYIPMGGNRVSRGRLFFNLMVVWGLTGIWHGASWNFLLWGLYFGVLLILEKGGLLKVLEKLPTVVRHLYTLFLVLISWTIFAIEDLGRLGGYLKTMFGLGAGAADPAAGYYARSFGPVFLIACLAATPLAKQLWEKLPKQARAILLPVLLLAGLVLCTAYLVDATYNPFLYFRF